MSETIIGVTDSHTSRRNCLGHPEYRLRHRWRERLGHHLPEDLMAWQGRGLYSCTAVPKCMQRLVASRR